MKIIGARLSTGIGASGYRCWTVSRGGASTAGPSASRTRVDAALARSTTWRSRDDRGKRLCKHFASFSKVRVRSGLVHLKLLVGYWAGGRRGLREQVWNGGSVLVADEIEKGRCLFCCAQVGVLVKDRGGRKVTNDVASQRFSGSCSLATDDETWTEPWSQRHGA